MPEQKLFYKMKSLTLIKRGNEFTFKNKPIAFIFFTKSMLEQKSCWTSSLYSNSSLQKYDFHVLNIAMRNWGLILKGFIIQISMYWQQHTRFHILLDSRYFSSIHLQQNTLFKSVEDTFISLIAKTSRKKKPNYISVLYW